MKQSLLTQFGTWQERMARALSDLKHGKGILLVDDEDRENEGDLIFPAETLTVRQMALLIRECSGIVCLCLNDEKIQSLHLPPMVTDNTSKYRTAFTVSIEAREGVTTGVSASDRVTTIKTAISDSCTPEDISSPGHVFPIKAKPGGVLERRGHTEGTVDLMKLAGLSQAGVLCELTNTDGTMAKLPEIVSFANRHGYIVLSIEDIVKQRKSYGDSVNSQT